MDWMLVIALVCLIGGGGFLLIVLIGALRMNKTEQLDCPYCGETACMQYRNVEIF